MPPQTFELNPVLVLTIRRCEIAYVQTFVKHAIKFGMAVAYMTWSEQLAIKTMSSTDILVWKFS